MFTQQNIKKIFFIFLFFFLTQVIAQDTAIKEEELKQKIQALEEEIQKEKLRIKETEEKLNDLKKSSGVNDKFFFKEYISPLKEKGLTRDFISSMLLDPEHAKEVRENKTFWLSNQFRVGFLLRPRWEDRKNLDFNSSTDDYTSRILQSSQLWFIFDPSPYWTVKFTIQDARVWGGSQPAQFGDRKYFFSNSASVFDPSQQNRTTVPNSTDIREGFVLLKIPDFPLKAFVGRQVFVFGDQRMIGGANWNTNGLSFDGLRISYESSVLDFHLFGAKMTASQNGPNGVLTANGRQNGSIDDSYLVGNYNTIKFPYFIVDIYEFGILKKWIPETPAYLGQKIIDEDIFSPRARQNDKLFTFGTRITNRTNNNFLPKSKSWDWTLEIATQLGYTGQRQYASWDLLKDENGKSYYSEKVKYTGKFFVFQTGYTFWDKLRFGTQFTYSSGDPNRRDGSHSTFELLPNPRFGIFPYFDSVAGLAENIGLKNIKSYNISINYQTEKWGLFTISGFIHRKAVREDAWYAISGDPNTGGSGSCNINTRASAFSTENCSGNSFQILKPLGAGIFNEIDFSWIYHYTEGVSVWMGIGYLKGGDSIRNAKTDPFNPNPEIRYNFFPNAYISYFMINVAM
jgi:hypothetical protein